MEPQESVTPSENAGPVATEGSHVQAAEIQARLADLGSDVARAFEVWWRRVAELRTREARGARAEVERTARDYIEGWYAGEADRMARSLHDELVKRAPDLESDTADDLRPVTKDRMVELTADGGGQDRADPHIVITVDAVSESIATARVVSPDFVDYLHLVNTPAGWQIANVLFHDRGEQPAAGPSRARVVRHQMGGFVRGLSAPPGPGVARHAGDSLARTMKEATQVRGGRGGFSRAGNRQINKLVADGHERYMASFKKKT